MAKCRWCGETIKDRMGDVAKEPGKECDRCWELETRITQDPELATNMLATVCSQRRVLAPVTGFEEFAARMLEITEGCRPDMHEPDEQDVDAVVTGFKLDNAMGDDPYHNVGEYTVGLGKWEGGELVGVRWFNLASLIALARIGAKMVGKVDRQTGEQDGLH